MIIQTGQRTDIPAFYSQWLLNRLKEGYVLVRNPYYPQSVSRYELNPEVVDLITFCTKNPIPVLQNQELLEKLKPYGQWWFVTLTPYGKEIEPNVPEKAAVADAIVQLGKLLGPDCVGWRYDPIFISEKYSVAYHLKAFENIAKRIEGYTKTAVISFIDLYPKVKRNFPEAREVSKDERIYLGKAMVDIAAKYGMIVKPCAEGEELSRFGADCSGCQTVAVLENAIGKKLKVPKKTQGRKECACYIHGDIGAYSSCGHLCRYCYANTDSKSVMQNMKHHNPKSPLLIGELTDADKIFNSPQKSWSES
ncbi:MAG: DUF1848 domain-containing protein [Treponema sp.]|uniref:DUF1848 domain-containing protein n=1 Tax=Treponema sp. TaxID=166 RepID=UPI00298DD5C2|nr:DUF1848 domain-containing protein [Treponema sp.]MCQ2600581.1 DUF1848 domain-containing protein [Treponema sp.]